MKYDLKAVRKLYGYSVQEMANFTEIMASYYSKYEEEGEIPSKYIYRLWLKIPDFPVPEDFFHYTSFTLVVNMKYYGLTQTQIAKMFEISNQSTISSLFSQNIPMYELKDKFHKFDPLIIPTIAKEKKKDYVYCPIEKLVVKGNFIATQKKKEARNKKQLATLSYA